MAVVNLNNSAQIKVFGLGDADAGIFYVHFLQEYDEEEEEYSYTTDKTFEECKEAIDAGKFVVAVVEEEPEGPVVEGLQLLSYVPMSSYTYVPQSEESSILFRNVVELYIDESTGKITHYMMWEGNITTSGSGMSKHEYTAAG